MPKGIPPIAKECRCWEYYPNKCRSDRGLRCSYYDCIQEYEWYPTHRKTICVLKEKRNELSVD